MKRFWLRLKEFFYSQLTDYAYSKYIDWRDKLVATQMKIKPNTNTWDSLSPERKAKVEKELDQMMAAFDRLEQNKHIIESILARLEEREKYINKGSRPEDHPWN